MTFYAWENGNIIVSHVIATGDKTTMRRTNNITNQKSAQPSPTPSGAEFLEALKKPFGLN